ncbi:DNA helicase RecQ [Adhaeribacter pallidiroseus]|uniref:DNA helicase RecQ n=1 Tax=Adhaeribacter pallidiroseus TaxID=2072847 RepID=A0A369QHE0_9BACT|nr:DNA helicase RecQ [Adhaeribacter pallidiroseus]RDC62636.1 DNA helicase [Adhaeribacter pallidiroseus]
MITAAQQILKKYFGYDRFRPMQQDIIDTVLTNRDAIVLMPTGGGKSMCYQVPALVMPGICVVVSPLIALMQDQVKALAANGVNAAFLNSTQTAEVQYNIETACLGRAIKLLYVSPEKLLSNGFFSFLKRLQINLFAIDEAHCISAWGHDFRPEYTQLRSLKEQFPTVPVIALTATADRLTQKDIQEQLRLQDPAIFISSFDRPNINLTVLPGRNRFNRITDFLDQHKGQPGIIYCLSRNTTESISQKLTALGYKAAHYHAGLSANARATTQNAFLKDNIQIMSATIAFGMGIDKSNVRWVIHYNLPKNIESYYQEIGRGGRDGAPANALLFYSYVDVLNLRKMLTEGEKKQQDLQLVKLERMQQYAEATSCRRKILLNYFGETLKKSCNNCDICRNPPASFDGTVHAQKALSAVARMLEKAPLGLVIDVLRGSRSQQVLEKNFDRIKTYGAGRDLSYHDWQSYLHQMINQGLLEIAYDDAYTLKITPTGKEVLMQSKPFALVKFEPNTVTEELAPVKTKSKKEVLKDELFERLRALRKKIADQNNVPPYVVFSDTTLSEMAQEKPTSRPAMLSISGVGMVKLENYGEAFINEIIAFVTDQQEQGHKVKGATHLVTLEAYKQGFKPDEIAAQRNLNIVTIYSHLATLYEQGYPIDMKEFISGPEYYKLEPVITRLGPEAKLKEYFDHFEGGVDYNTIRMALAVYKRKLKAV